jgi:hypothetical protein
VRHRPGSAALIGVRTPWNALIGVRRADAMTSDHSLLSTPRVTRCGTAAFGGRRLCPGICARWRSPGCSPDATRGSARARSAPRP